MKTNKEIKPFKMRVSKKEYAESVRILLSNGYRWGWHTEDDVEEQPIYYDSVAITLEESLVMMRYTAIDSQYDDDCLPELTYSEFMKLYGEEEEVFTMDEVINIVEYIRNNCEIIDKDFFINNQLYYSEKVLANFLSERTND